jgi:DDE superfamily endonuclease
MSTTRARADLSEQQTAEVVDLHKRQRAAATSKKTYPVTLFVRKRSDEWPTTHGGEQYPFLRAGLQRNLERLRSHVKSGMPLSDWKVRRRGAPRTLNDDQEKLVVRRTNKLARTMAGVTLNMVRAEVEAVAAIRLPGEEDDTAAIARVKRCAGKDHLFSFRKRHGLAMKRQSRPMEKERVMAQQPELRVSYYRLIYRAHALAHAHRRFLELTSPTTTTERRADLSRKLRNYSMRDGVLDYNAAGGGGGVLTVKDDRFWVPDLEEELKFTPPSLVVNGDEKPWDTNQCRQTSLSTRSVRANVQSGARSPYWTVMCWIRANGEAMPPLLILNGKSVQVSAALSNALRRSNASMTATERGFMEDAVFVEELRRACTLLGNGEQPAIMLLDGHGSRLQRGVARVLAKHHVYCVLEPANSSTENQALDNGAMAAFNNQYRSLYTMWINLNQRVSVEDKAILALQAYDSASKSAQFRSCWAGAMLDNGIPQVHKLEPKVCLSRHHPQHHLSFRQSVRLIFFSYVALFVGQQVSCCESAEDRYTCPDQGVLLFILKQ